MPWFYKVTYEGGVPCAERDTGPFPSDADARSNRAECMQRSASLGRNDVFGEVEEKVIKTAIMIASELVDGVSVEYIYYDDGSKEPK